MAPEVWIGIRNDDGVGHLENCLRSIFEKTEYDNFRVVVHDNDSSDGSVEMVSDTFDDVTVIEQTRDVGLVTANNELFEAAIEHSADYILLLDNDITILEEGWLGTLVEIAESDDSIGILGCRIRTDDGFHSTGRYYPLSEFLFPRRKQQYQYNRHDRDLDRSRYTYVDDVPTAFYFVRTSMVEDVGYMDEAFDPNYYEETDYCCRAHNAGYRVAYTDEVEVFHEYHGTLGDADDAWRIYMKQRHHVRHILTNYPVSWIVPALPRIVLMTTRLFVERTENGVRINDGVRTAPWRHVRFFLKLYLGILSDVVDIARKRRSRSNVKSLVK